MVDLLLALIAVPLLLAWVWWGMFKEADMECTHYSSGRPRVHATGSRAEIEAAIKEYLAFGGEPDLVVELRETAVDLQEELELRKVENVGGYD